MNKLYDALEYCLQALEDGASMDTVLARYPDLVDELRPILEASLAARRMAAPAPSVETVRRGRVRLLQRTSELRAVRRPGRRFIPFFQRMAFALALAGVFLLSGTGLVSASSTALPGENLYPVKRTWEDVRLLFVFDPTHREALEGEYEQERLIEISELLREGRTASITFSGVVTLRQGNQLVVAGVPVLLSAQTRYFGDPIAAGMAVTVIGRTQPGGVVIADEIRPLLPGSVLPVSELSRTPKPSSVPSRSWTSEPSEMPNPSDTVEPPETPGPSETVEPSDTPHPSATIEPSETPNPSETVEPPDTPHPSATIEPSETPNPSKTVEPPDTPAPSETPNPSELPNPSETPDAPSKAGLSAAGRLFLGSVKAGDVTMLSDTCKLFCSVVSG